MSIVLARIDNRLIHGQVLEAWVPHIRADCIVVANAEVAAVPIQKMLMEAAVPGGIRVIIAPIDEVVGIFKSGALDRNRVMVLFASSQDSLQAHKKGLPFTSLNLGNMHAGKDKVRFSCTLALHIDDIRNLEQLQNYHVVITAQCIPTDTPRDWQKLVPDSGS